MDRRKFLILSVAAGVSGVIPSGCTFLAVPQPTGSPFTPARWKGVRYPVPLPGEVLSPSALRTFEVVDDLVLSPEFEYEVLAMWGQSFGPEGHSVTVGYNCDFTGLIPFPGSTDDHFLVINHEYVSARPWTAAYQSVFGRPLPDIRFVPDVDSKDSQLITIDGNTLIARDLTTDSDPRIVSSVRRLSHALIDEVGVTILHVRRSGNQISVVADSPHHKRITGQSRYNIGVHSDFKFTGPAAQLLSSSPAGTLANCGGTITPWNTMLTCEENIQEWVVEEITPSGEVYSPEACRLDGERNSTDELPIQWEGIGAFADPPLEARQFGWVTEIDPVTGALKKHTALGRFRHENISLRVIRGERLVAYMGEDRRGGHLWKYVSDGTVDDSSTTMTSRLLEEGTLYVARFESDGTGNWIPLRPSTPLVRPEISNFASKHILLPRRPEGGQVPVGMTGSQYNFISMDEWVQQVEEFAGRSFDQVRLRDLVSPNIRSRSDLEVQWILLLDAFAFANAIGGTPLARPEGVQANDRDGSIYVAFTDSSARQSGSPDMRIFPDASEATSRRYGDLFRIDDGKAKDDVAEFSWSRWVASGEVSDGGGGFACADNLFVDREGNLWMMCDITTEALNRAVSRSAESLPGTKNFQGIFGNNALFCIETIGASLGIPKCFAIGPMESELSGLTSTADGEIFILSVQHPGEYSGRRVSQTADVMNRFSIAQFDGTLFEQIRKVPIGSNFPSGEEGEHPRPCVVAIRRKRD